MTPTFELDHTEFEDNRRYANDKHLFVKFHIVPVKNETKSLEAGRPIYDDVEHVTILTPGQRDTLVTESTDHYRRRFRDAYAKFKAGQDAVANGTPLDLMPGLTPGQVMEFKHMHIHTVEQLANLSDSVGSAIMGYYEIKRKAQAYLDAAKGIAPTTQLQEELAKKDEQIKGLQDMMGAMKAQLDKLTAAAEKPAAAQKIMPTTKAA